MHAMPVLQAYGNGANREMSACRQADMVLHCKANCDDTLASMLSGKAK